MRGKVFIAFALVAALIIVRSYASDIFIKTMIYQELTKPSTDYRAVATIDAIPAGLVRVTYPFYWTKTGKEEIVLSTVRFTGSINKMRFEPMTGGEPVEPESVIAGIKNETGARDILLKQDSTIRGVPVDLYRYGTGENNGKGYHLFIVAIFPTKMLKVTSEQYYEEGSFAEDDVVTGRMLNVLYGIEFID